MDAYYSFFKKFEIKINPAKFLVIEFGIFLLLNHIKLLKSLSSSNVHFHITVRIGFYSSRESGCHLIYKSYPHMSLTNCLSHFWFKCVPRFLPKKNMTSLRPVARSNTRLIKDKLKLLKLFCKRLAARLPAKADFAGALRLLLPPCFLLSLWLVNTVEKLILRLVSNTGTHQSLS